MIAESLSDSGNDLINRGVSGDRLQNLDARWAEDCLKLQPQVVTILIGINNVWRQFDSDERLDLAIFEMTYQRLIDRTSPVAQRIILMEPFLIPAAPDKAPMRPLADASIHIVRPGMKAKNRLIAKPPRATGTSLCSASIGSRFSIPRPRRSMTINDPIRMVSPTKCRVSAMMNAAVFCTMNSWSQERPSQVMIPFSTCGTPFRPC